MAAELRWILLALSVPLLAGIWWWTARGSRLAPGNPELRETPPEPAHLHAPQPAESSLHAPPLHEAASYESALEHRADTGPRDFGVPPFEPLSIRTAGFEDVPIVDMAMTADGEPVEVESLDVGAAQVESAIEREPLEYHESGRAPDQPHELQEYHAPRGEPDEPREPQPMEPEVSPPHPSNEVATQRIVTLRVCAQETSRWSGAELMAALENNGLVYGRYQVFHRKDSDGRTLFCAASLVEPGTFDLQRMPYDEFRGLTLFAVLPGPADAVHTIDAMTATAEELAAGLRGTVQDSNGAPLSADRADELRADAAQFQASLMS